MQTHDKTDNICSTHAAAGTATKVGPRVQIDSERRMAVRVKRTRRMGPTVVSDDEVWTGVGEDFPCID